MSSEGSSSSRVQAPASPPLNPLAHLLDPSSSNFSDDEPEADDTKGVKSAASDALIPEQNHSIIQERTIIRYYTDISKEAELIENPSSAAKEDCIDVSLLLDVTNGCGGKIWPAAQVLGSYILGKKEQLSSSWNGKTIIELGSGTGLIGFLVAKMKINTKIWITDQDVMIDLMKENMELNNGAQMDPCYIAELNWGEPIPATEKDQQRIPAKPDVLLLADCVYLESAFQPLVDTMRDLSTTETEILFCYQKRRKADKRFFGLLKRHFTFADITDDDPARTQQYNRAGTRLYRVHLKPSSA
ncbi:unnamed protein product [Sympodiomycopsis kandeliae]